MFQVDIVSVKPNVIAFGDPRGLKDRYLVFQSNLVFGAAMLFSDEMSNAISKVVSGHCSKLDSLFEYRKLRKVREILLYGVFTNLVRKPSSTEKHAVEWPWYWVKMSRSIAIKLTILHAHSIVVFQINFRRRRAGLSWAKLDAGNLENLDKSFD